MSRSSAKRASLGSRGDEDDSKPPPNPVKIEKLPPTLRLPRANLNMPPV